MVGVHTIPIVTLVLQSADLVSELLPQILEVGTMIHVLIIVSERSIHVKIWLLLYGPTDGISV